MSQYSFRKNIPSLVFTLLFFVFLFPLCVDTTSYLIYHDAINQKTARVDIAVKSSSQFAKIFVSTQDDGVSVSFPDWLKNKHGQGATVAPKQGLFSYSTYKLQITASEDSQLNISFLGEDKRRNKQRYPVFSKYRDIKIDGAIVYRDKSVTWHDNRLSRTINIRGGGKTTVEFSVKRHVPRFSELKERPSLSCIKLFLIGIVSIVLGAAIGDGYKWAKQKSSDNKRVVFYDFLRVVAILFVIYNHTPGYHYYLRGIADFPSDFFYIPLSVFTRFNVPMFFAVSGILLLGRNEPIGLIFKKRIFRILIVIVVFSLLGTYSNYLTVGQCFDVEALFRGVVVKNLPNTGHLWFLYAYIGLLLLLPFLRKIAVSMSKEEFCLLLGIGVMSSTVIPLINLGLRYFEVKPLVIDTNVWRVIAFVGGKSVFYALVGFYIDKHVEVRDLTRRHVIYCLGVLVSAIVIATSATLIEHKITGKFTQGYLDSTLPFVVIPLFIITKRMFLGVNDGWFCELVRSLGPLIFFVYLFDIVLKSFVWDFYTELIWQVPGMKDLPVLYSFIWGGISIVISGTMIYILRKSPLVRKFI